MEDPTLIERSLPRESNSLPTLRLCRRPRDGRGPRSRAPPRRGRRQGRGRRAEFLRHAHHRRQVPDQAAIPVRTGRRVRRRGRGGRPGRDRLCARRSGDGVHQFRRGGRAGGGEREPNRQDPRRTRFRPRRRSHHHVRHQLPGAAPSRQAEIRRDARGARRLGWRRARRGRTRTADGRTRHRLRLDRRQGRVRPRARRA